MRCVAAVLAMALSLGASEYPKPDVREEQTVVVNGVSETWQLVWLKTPRVACGFGDPDAITCPCRGFAYGETGEMDLVRLMGNAEVDRLHLTPLFEESPGDGAIVQRWPRNESGDDAAPGPPVQVMSFADFDHDGAATEFYLQTEAAPCGKSYGVVIGVSKTNPRLHAFGTASKPDRPLHLQRAEWEALRNSSGPVTVMDWECEDHGAETETNLTLRWSAAGISGTRREYSCPGGAKSGRLVQESPL